jgi:hypothetical protein
VLIVDADRWILYSSSQRIPAATAGGPDQAPSGTWQNSTRPPGWTSADAAGLPILPGLVRWDEVEQGTLRTRSASPCAPGEPTSPRRITGQQRHRVPAAADAGAAQGVVRHQGYPARAQVVLRALKRYGMIVADNGSGTSAGSLMRVGMTTT